MLDNALIRIRLDSDASAIRNKQRKLVGVWETEAYSRLEPIIVRERMYCLERE